MFVHAQFQENLPDPSIVWLHRLRLNRVLWQRVKRLNYVSLLVPVCVLVRQPFANPWPQPKYSQDHKVDDDAYRCIAPNQSGEHKR